MGATTDYRIEPREDGTLDEVVVQRPDWISLEQMSNQLWTLMIALSDGRQIIVHLNSKSQRIFGQADIEG